MTIGMTFDVDPYIRTTGLVEHLANEKIVVETIELENWIGDRTLLNRIPESLNSPNQLT